MLRKALQLALWQQTRLEVGLRLGMSDSAVIDSAVDGRAGSS
jgi:hypothetical protein